MIDNVRGCASVATAQLKLAEPAELSHQLAHDQNGLGWAHELAEPGVHLIGQLDRLG